MSHYGENHDPSGQGFVLQRTFKNKSYRPLKWFLVIGSTLLVLLIVTIIAVIVLAVSATSLKITGMQQTVVDLWQMVNGWFQPVSDLYNRAVKLAPGQA